MTESKTLSNWQKRDLQVNWHPYVQHQTMDAPITMIKGKGTLLWDEDGKEYIDAIASWWCNPHGHAHPHIIKSITEQLQTLEHVLFGGFTHPSAIILSERLLEVLPENQNKIFYSDNGSTAVEVALKMAFQFFWNKGEQKKCIIAFEDSFHGDTFGAMAASGINFFTTAFQDFFIKVVRIPTPNSQNIEKVETRLKEIISTEDPAAFIFEPLIQGAAGMKIFSAEHLDRLLKICKENKVLTIADEVMTGFGRTGKLFASNYLKESVDIFCLSKALTGGFIPMSVTSSSNEIYNAFLSDDTNKALFHGHTFMANPAGCAAALASLDLSLSTECQESIKRINSKHKQFIKVIKEYKSVSEIGHLGVILRFKVASDEESSYYGALRKKMFNYFMDKGIIARPVGNILYMLPPFCITNDELDRVYEVFLGAIKKFGKN